MGKNTTKKSCLFVLSLAPSIIFLAMPHVTSELTEIDDPETLSGFDWRSMNLQQPTGYFAMVSISTDPQHHEQLRQLPLVPQLEEVKYADLSPVSKEHLRSVLKNPRTYKSKKLIASFRPRKKILLHYMHLRMCLEEGATLDEVHKVFSFKQERHIAMHVETCVRLRREAVNKFLSNFFKLMLNATFGSFLLRKSKYIQVDFVIDHRKAVRLFNSPRFLHATILSEHILMIFSLKPTVTLDSLIFVGFTILVSLQAQL